MISYRPSDGFADNMGTSDLTTLDGQDISGRVCMIYKPLPDKKSI
jgi:hypothetical protein